MIFFFLYILRFRIFPLLGSPCDFLMFLRWPDNIGLPSAKQEFPYILTASLSEHVLLPLIGCVHVKKKQMSILRLWDERRCELV